MCTRTAVLEAMTSSTTYNEPSYYVYYVFKVTGSSLKDTWNKDEQPSLRSYCDSAVNKAAALVTTMITAATMFD